MEFNKEKNFYSVVAKNNPKDKIIVEVGDSKEKDIFYPQTKIMRWNNECNLSIRLKEFHNFSVNYEQSKIRLSGEKKDLEIYEITDGEGFHEFEVILKEKPESNELNFSLNYKDVKFLFQPPLNTVTIPVEGAIATETDVYDKEGNVIIHRPIQCVGSYAVYSNSNKINYVGGNEYRCGKICHIYRPKIKDKKGAKIWGKLEIFNNTLKIIIPQNFLDEAEYPVRVDPTFGYTSLGGDTLSGAANRMYGNRNIASGGAGTVDSISAAMKFSNPYFPYLSCALYKYSDKSLVGYTEEWQITYNHNGFHTFNPVGTINIEDISYDMLYWQSLRADQRADYESGWFRIQRNATYNYPTFPDPIVDTGGLNNYRVSMYVTFTEAPTTNIKAIDETLKSNIGSILDISISLIKEIIGLN